MRNFIIFFSEKEGSSALMYLLDNFKEIDVVHQVNNQGWEPLDWHRSGNLSVYRLKKMLRYIYADQQTDLQRINKFYRKTAPLPLDAFDKDKCIGLKMRLKAHQYIYPVTQTRFTRWNDYWHRKLQQTYPARFRQSVLRLLAKYRVTVFLTVRQDVLRWALSKYHGDGTGNPGHLQFKLAAGELGKSDIQKIHVDCDKLEELIIECESVHAAYRDLIEELKAYGIKVYPLKYEEFLNDKQSYFTQVGEYLGLDWSEEQIDAAIAAGSYLKKVHSNKIEDFVTNHREVEERFADRFVAW